MASRGTRTAAGSVPTTTSTVANEPGRHAQADHVLVLAGYERRGGRLLGQGRDLRIRDAEGRELLAGEIDLQLRLDQRGPGSEELLLGRDLLVPQRVVAREQRLLQVEA